jgi:hypothetical protein
MAAFRPEIFTIDEVINFYDAAEGSEYRIFAGVNPTPQYLRYNFVGEKEIGRQELLNALTQLRNNIENYNPYLIQVISEGSTGRGKKKESPVLTSISFQLNRPQQLMPMQSMSGIGSPRTEMLLEKLVEQNQMLASRIAAIEAMDELEGEEEEEAPKSPIDQMLSSPQVQEALIAGVMSLMSGLMTKGAPTAIAGIDDEAEAVEILRSLMSKGVTIDHLRKLNEMSSAKLSSLLFML